MAGKHKDDDILWDKVKRTVKPLESNRADRFPELFKETGNASTERGSSQFDRKLGRIFRPEPPKFPDPKAQASLLDEPTRKKISKGRLQIDAQLDLHGMTQLQAYARLSQFLEYAHNVGNRTILVITGKGAGGAGILRNAVPRWLGEPGLKQWVIGFHEAAVNHGGSGAIYVRIRRKKLDY